MTCKDCLHCGICRCDVYFVINEKEMKEIQLQDCDKVEDKCDHFKNKADVVEVVRCKNCVYANEKGDTCYFGEGRFVTPEHYCSNGERKCDNG